MSQGWEIPSRCVSTCLFKFPRAFESLATLPQTTQRQMSPIFSIIPSIFSSRLRVVILKGSPSARKGRQVPEKLKIRLVFFPVLSKFSAVQRRRQRQVGSKLSGRRGLSSTWSQHQSHPTSPLESCPASIRIHTHKINYAKEGRHQSHRNVDFKLCITFQLSINQQINIFQDYFVH